MKLINRITLLAGILGIFGLASLYGQPISDPQGDVVIGGLAPDPSAVLDLQSTTKGFLMPRMTDAQRDGIVDPATGLMFFNTDSNAFQVNTGSASSPVWETVLTDSTIGDVAWQLGGNLAPVTNIFGTLDGTDIDIRTDDVTAVTVSGTDQSVTASSDLSVEGSTTLGDDDATDELSVNGEATFTETGGGIGLSVDESNGGTGLRVIERGGGHGVQINENGTGDALLVNNGGTGNAITASGDVAIDGDASVTGNTTLGDTGDNTTVNVTGAELTVTDLTDDTAPTTLLTINGSDQVRETVISGLTNTNDGPALISNGGTLELTDGNAVYGEGTENTLPLWVDGSPTSELGNSIVSQDAAGTTVSISGNASISGNTDANGGLDVTGTLALVGGTSPLSANGSSGNSGDVLLSGGAGTTPSWTSPNGLFWELGGNTGTTPGTHFVGTSDITPLHIYVNGGASNRLILNTNASIQRLTAGNPRGVHAVDLQSQQTVAAQVASGPYSTIGGGWLNTASGSQSTVSGGVGGVASGSFSTVAGGTGNIASGGAAAALGGQQNTASGQFSTTSGGVRNTASGTSSFIGGGRDNAVSGNNTVIGGGLANVVTGTEATVAGGLFNRAIGDWSTVGGGRDDSATGRVSTVAGGQGNKARGNYSSIGGGFFNTTGGAFNAIPGGRGLTLNGDFSTGFLGNNPTGANDATVTNGNVAFFGNVDLWLGNNDNDATQIRVYAPNATAGDFPPTSTYYTSFEAPDFGQGGNIEYILPATAPTAGQSLEASAVSTAGPTTTVTLKWANNGVPVGTIVMWSGTIATIPSGWALCNGANGTPNLQGKFVLGAGNVVPAVGSNDHKTTSTGTLTTSTDGAHVHNPGTGTGGGFAPGSITIPIPDIPTTTILPKTVLFPGATIAGIGIPEIAIPKLELPGIVIPDAVISLDGPTTTASAGNHNHTVGVPYYALAYIMRIQ